MAVMIVAGGGTQRRLSSLAGGHRLSYYDRRHWVPAPATMVTEGQPPTRATAGTTLPTNARRFDGQPLRTPREIELQIEQFLRSRRRLFGPYPDLACAQSPMERAHRLPLEPVRRIAAALALADRLGPQHAAGNALLALRA